MTRIVAIAGVPGSGKSTLSQGLADALDAALLHMDHYERMTAQPLQDIARWMERGADYDELPLPMLVEHLASLKEGHAVSDPATGKRIEPMPWVIFETQFGREHRASGSYIDFLIWLETPLDLALARKLRAVAAYSAHPLAGMQGYLEGYSSLVRELIVMQKERVASRADIILSGEHDVTRLVTLAREAVLTRLDSPRGPSR